MYLAIFHILPALNNSINSILGFFWPNYGIGAVKNEASIDIIFNLIFIFFAATKSGTSKINRLMQQTFSVHWG